MTDREIDLVRETVRATIAELRRAGMLRDVSAVEMEEAVALIRAYYDDGEADPSVSRALDELERDQYWRIIPLYYRYGYTLEQIAEALDVEVSTVSRNKRRLLIEIYRKSG